MPNNYQQILKQYWGYDSFRGIQAEIIESIGAGRDTLGLMPTGGGKSITFQVPALAMEGLCLVITPLIALMKDQVENLRQRGIRAVAIYSGMSRDDIIRTLDNCIFGPYKFLYISPERLATDIFRAKVQKMRISMITVDESHCISQWGYDFRPAYLEIAQIRQLLPQVPVLALTATATPEVVDDIQNRLGFTEKNVYRMSFERKNLAYIVRRTEQKEEELTRILGRVPGSAIVYVRNRRRTREMAQLLNEQEISAEFYHAGLDDATKDLRQQRWQKGESRVMVATNAFGMGIDKPDVRIVIHMDVPDSIEAYFQEAGRAGRDGEKAYAVMLYTATDHTTLQRRVADNFPEKDYIRKAYEDLQYFYQMAMGDGRGCVREFDMDKFCRTFKHFPVQLDSALRILTQAGYIEYTEEQNNASRLLFTVRRDELYKLRHLGEDMDLLIQTVLRSYTGLFTEYAFISEEALATRTGLTRRTVYELLMRLAKMRIVSYVPQKRTPYIIYTRERVEKEDIVIAPSVYEERKARYERRVKAMLEYVESETICRSRQLLDYFGERNEHLCGLCDVCAAQKKQTQTLAQPPTRAWIAALLDKQALTPAQVAQTFEQAHPQTPQETLTGHHEALANLLQEMLENKEIVSENGLLKKK